MTHVHIPIPGDTTRYDDSPDVRIIHSPGSSIHLTITYTMGYRSSTGVIPKACIRFSDVLEYRWISDSVTYQDFDEHRDDYQLGLIEIVPSRYVQRMASRGVWKDHPTMRFGNVLHETQVKHYRLAFDEYGHFDVIALDLLIEEIRPEEDR